MIDTPSAAEYLDSITKFEQRAFVRKLGYSLGDVIFPEVKSCMDRSCIWKGAGLSKNKDMHAKDAFDSSGAFVMPIVLRMVKMR